jgi:hypothetical protein
MRGHALLFASHAFVIPGTDRIPNEIAKCRREGTPALSYGESNAKIFQKVLASYAR